MTWTDRFLFFVGSWDRPGSAAVPSARDEPRMTDTVLTGRLGTTGVEDVHHVKCKNWKSTSGIIQENPGLYGFGFSKSPGFEIN